MKFKTVLLASSEANYNRLKEDLEEYGSFLFPSYKKLGGGMPKNPVTFYSSRPRPVRIKVVKYELCPGARHYYVDIKEEDDVVWDGRIKGWRKPWNNTNNYGKSFSSKFDNVVQAKEYINKTINENFNPKKHFLVFKDDFDEFLYWR
jgi:hypothetical protein